MVFFRLPYFRLHFRRRCRMFHLIKQYNIHNTTQEAIFIDELQELSNHKFELICCHLYWIKINDIFFLQKHSDSWIYWISNSRFHIWKASVELSGMVSNGQSFMKFVNFPHGVWNSTALRIQNQATNIHDISNFTDVN